jgi:hypothetical protein
MNGFTLACLALAIAVPAAVFAAGTPGEVEKMRADSAKLTTENAALRVKVEALGAVRGQCLEAVEQYRAARAGQ